MNGERSKDLPGKDAIGNGGSGKEKDPAWTNSLRQLYDSVVDEPLPDNFKDLLRKLDEES